MDVLPFLSFVSAQTPLPLWLTFIVSVSERLPKQYSSVLKWGNLDSPAYPLLLASWWAHSHLLSQSIHPLVALFPLALLSSSSSILSVPVFSKTSSYRLNIFFGHLLICSVARPHRGRQFSNVAKPCIMRQVLLPQPPSHTEIPASSLFHRLSLSLCATDCFCAVSK